MGEPELHASKFISWVPACESGQHVGHPGETCDEWEAYAAAARALYETAIGAALAAALTPPVEVPASLRAWLDGDITDGVMAELHREIDQLVNGNGTGEMRGFLDWDDWEATPMERAFAILDPHLRACPLYNAGPPAIYLWKA